MRTHLKSMLLIGSLALLVTGCADKADCEVDGTTYAEGEQWDEACNTCTCEDGAAACTEMACDTGG